MRKIPVPAVIAIASLSLVACGKPAAAPAPSAPAPATAQAATPPAKPVALALVTPMSAAPLPVSSLAIGAGHRIADRNTAYHQGLSPPLLWGSAAGAQSWVVMVEDPDAPSPRPFLHWLAWNLPAATLNLPEGLTRATTPPGMVEGLNGKGDPGWVAPKPPPGTGDHHYHFQVFALDTLLNLASAASRDDVVAAMKGHVLAAGETVGLAKAP